MPSQLDLDNLFFCKNDFELFYPSWFLNRKIICGQKILDFFSNSLKLHILKISLIAIIWQYDHFEINLLDQDGSQLTFFVKKKNDKIVNTGGIGVALVNDSWSIFMKNTNFSRSNQLLLLKMKSFFVKILPWDFFRSIFVDQSKIIVDSISGEIMSELSADNEQGGCTEFPLYEWGRPQVKYSFFQQAMIKKKKSTGLDIEAVGIDYSIEHADYECSNMSKQHLINHLALLKSEDQSRILDLGTFITQLNGQVPNKDFDSERHRQIISNLNDNDIILGATDKLKVFLKDIVKENKSHVVYINTCCTPLIIGDDIKSLKKEYEQLYDLKISYQDPIYDNTGLNNHDYIKDLFKKHENNNQKVKEQPSVNVVGFLPSQATLEVFTALSMFNVKINTVLLPKFKEKLIENYFKADLQVLFANSEYDFLYNDIFKNLNVPYVIPAVPYGFKMTSDFYMQLAEYFKLDISANQDWNMFFAPLKTRWNNLCVEARKHRLGFICTATDMNILLNSTNFLFSLPLFSVLEEMGFGLDVLFHGQLDEYQEFKNKISQNFLFLDRHTFKFCSACDELENWLGLGDYSAVYSDLRFDKRSSKFGKTSFNVFDFEMGYEGALRTINRLLTKCKNSYYKSYYPYFVKQPRAIIFEENNL